MYKSYVPAVLSKALSEVLPVGSRIDRLNTMDSFFYFSPVGAGGLQPFTLIGERLFWVRIQSVLECVSKMPEAQFRRLCLHFGVDFP